MVCMYECLVLDFYLAIYLYISSPLHLDMLPLGYMFLPFFLLCYMMARSEIPFAKHRLSNKCGVVQDMPVGFLMLFLQDHQEDNFQSDKKPDL